MRSFSKHLKTYVLSDKVYRLLDNKQMLTIYTLKHIYYYS